MKNKARYFHINKYETRFSIIFRIGFANKHGGMGAEILDGLIQSESEEQAATTMKIIIKNAVAQAGFKENKSEWVSHS